MKFIAKATSINGLASWKGYYAEIENDGEKVPVIIGIEEGVPYRINPHTLRWFTGIQTEKAEDIYEGDKVQVWEDCNSVIGIVKWSFYDAGWVVEDEFGEYHDLVGDTRIFVK